MEKQPIKIEITPEISSKIVEEAISEEERVSRASELGLPPDASKETIGMGMGIKQKEELAKKFGLPNKDVSAEILEIALKLEEEKNK